MRYVPIERALSRSRYAALGAGIGAAIGALYSKDAAKTGAALGAYLGATVGETRITAQFSVERVKGRKENQLKRISLD